MKSDLLNNSSESVQQHLSNKTSARFTYSVTIYNAVTDEHNIT